MTVTIPSEPICILPRMAALLNALASQASPDSEDDPSLFRVCDTFKHLPPGQALIPPYANVEGTRLAAARIGGAS